MLFLRKKPSAIILSIKDKPKYLSEIARDTGTTYVYVTNIARLMESKGIVSISAQGKKRMVKLTEKGKEIAKLIEELMEKEKG